MSVVEILEQCLDFGWSKCLLLNFRQRALVGMYLDPQIGDSVFLKRCRLRNLWGGTASLHHKVMYWLSVRGFRQEIIVTVRCFRFVRKQLGRIMG